MRIPICPLNLKLFVEGSEKFSCVLAAFLARAYSLLSLAFWAFNWILASTFIIDKKFPFR